MSLSRGVEHREDASASSWQQHRERDRLNALLARHPSPPEPSHPSYPAIVRERLAVLRQLDWLNTVSHAVGDEGSSPSSSPSSSDGWAVRLYDALGQRSALELGVSSAEALNVAVLSLLFAWYPNTFSGARGLDV